MEEPIYWQFEGNSKNGKAWEVAIDQLQEEYSGTQIDFILCVSPAIGRSSPVYQPVKRKCLRDGIPVQFVLKNTISKGKSLRNIAKNVLIQIQAKISGGPWGLSNIPILKAGPTMIVGIDVVHNVGKQRRSVLCLSATLDKNVSKYFSTQFEVDRPHDVAPKNLEIDVQVPFTEALNAFKKACKCLPDQIIVYRDTTSDGQRENMREKEVDKIREALNAENLSEAKFLFMTVNKNIEQRFWEGKGKKQQNPRHGLFIDDSSMTRDGRLEFFMICHKAFNQDRAGLQAPVRLDSLALDNWDDLKLKELYDMTYGLTYGFFNY